MGSIYFHSPIGMWAAEPYKKLIDDMGPTGKGIYYDVFELVRQGRGVDSLDHILMLYDGVKNVIQRRSWKKKLLLILSPKYNLFFVNPQRQVSIIDHTKNLREQNRKALEGPSLFDMEGFY